MFFVNKTSKSTELSCTLRNFNKSTCKDIDIYCQISRVQINDRVQIAVRVYIDYVGCVSCASYVSYIDCASYASCVDCIDSIDYERCSECGCEYSEFCAHHNHHYGCCAID